jgi:hypothetical protein
LLVNSVRLPAQGERCGGLLLPRTTRACCGAAIGIAAGDELADTHLIYLDCIPGRPRSVQAMMESVRRRSTVLSSVTLTGFVRPLAALEVPKRRSQAGVRFDERDSPRSS